MKLSGCIRLLRNSIIRSFIVLALISFASASYAQSVPDFSGVWVQDTAKSDDFYKAFDVMTTITQTPQTITITTKFSNKDDKEGTSRSSSFNLDGKEVSKEEDGGINKDIASWSADKKTLTTKSTRTVGKDVYGNTVSYSLSNNGLVLTVKSSDINPFGLSITQVFNKKR